MDKHITDCHSFYRYRLNCKVRFKQGMSAIRMSMTQNLRTEKCKYKGYSCYLPVRWEILTNSNQSNEKCLSIKSKLLMQESWFLWHKAIAWEYNKERKKFNVSMSRYFKIRFQSLASLSNYKKHPFKHHTCKSFQLFFSSSG